VTTVLLCYDRDGPSVVIPRSLSALQLPPLRITSLAVDFFANDFLSDLGEISHLASRRRSHVAAAPAKAQAELVAGRPAIWSKVTPACNLSVVKFPAGVCGTRSLPRSTQIFDLYTRGFIRDCHPVGLGCQPGLSFSSAYSDNSIMRSSN
jgi:hypothetical protein